MDSSVGAVNGTIRQRVAAAQRIVIKMGTNVIMRDDGALAVGLVYGIVESTVNVLRSGRQVLFVSSGARADLQSTRQSTGTNANPLGRHATTRAASR